MSPNQENSDTSYKKRLERARELHENKNYEEASALYHQLIDEAKENMDDPLILWVELAWVYYYLKRFESTIICLNQVVAHADEYEKMVDIFRLIGYSHQHLGRPQKAIDAHVRALELVDESGPERKFLLFEIGQIHFQRGEYPIARKYLEEARELFEMESDNEGLAKIYYSLGFTYYYLGNYQDALILFEDMEAIAEDKKTKSLAFYGQIFVDLNFSNFENIIKKAQQIFTLDPDFEDKETIAYFLCISYKALQDRVNFDLFYSQLKENYSEGKYANQYNDLENW